MAWLPENRVSFGRPLVFLWLYMALWFGISTISSCFFGLVGFGAFLVLGQNPLSRWCDEE